MIFSKTAIAKADYAGSSTTSCKLASSVVVIVASTAAACGRSAGSTFVQPSIRVTIVCGHDSGTLQHHMHALMLSMPASMSKASVVYGSATSAFRSLTEQVASQQGICARYGEMCKQALRCRTPEGWMLSSLYPLSTAYLQQDDAEAAGRSICFG